MAALSVVFCPCQWASIDHVKAPVLLMLTSTVSLARSPKTGVDRKVIFCGQQAHDDIDHLGVSSHALPGLHHARTG